jgi:hypothetical protein
MLLFLKFNRVYLNQKNLDQKKEFKSYILTLLNWRPNSYIIPPVTKNQMKKILRLLNNHPQLHKLTKN